MNGTDFAMPLAYNYSDPDVVTVAGFTKFEYMVIEFVKSTLINYSDDEICVRHSIKTAQEVIKQLNQLENGN